MCMKKILLIATAILLVAPTFAQENRGAIVLDERDSSAMAILAEYDDARFASDELRILHWMPMSRIERLYPLGIDPETPNILSATPSIRVSTPIFRDRNSITLRLGSEGHLRISITNGSAYNYMPWPNSPAGYRDARTLSFPVPR